MQWNVGLNKRLKYSLQILPPKRGIQLTSKTACVVFKKMSSFVYVIPLMIAREIYCRVIYFSFTK